MTLTSDAESERTVPQASVQLHLWNESVPATDQDDLEDDSEPMVTKDLVALVDAPIASSANLLTLKIEVNGPNGTTIVQERLGKVALRSAPHPYYVRVGDQIKKRDEAVAAKDKFKEVMVEVVTTVIYEGGVVTPLHHDVLHVLLKRLNDDWQQTGSRSGTIRTSKREIIETLGLSKNGRISEEIERAFTTLKGLTVCKVFRNAADHTGEALPEVIQCLGGIIVNSEIIRAATTTGLRGRKADVITVDLNPKLVRALTGEEMQREWVLRSLNFTATLRYTNPWKKQLFRMIDARFDRIGYFNMPLIEMWVGCLGRSAETINTMDGWREARRQIMDFFKELEATGYIQELQTPVSRRKADDLVPLRKPVEFQVRPNENMVVSVQAPYGAGDALEWVYCKPGEAFFAQRPLRRRDFAHDILHATCPDKDTAKRLLERCGSEVIVQISYERLKKLLAEIGDRRDRLPMDQWFSQVYPVAPVRFLVNWLWKERERRDAFKLRGELRVPLEAPHAERRMTLARKMGLGVLNRCQISTEKFGETLLSLADLHQDLWPMREAYRFARDKALEELGRGREALDEIRCLSDPYLAEDFRSAVHDASHIALVAGGLTYQSHVLRDKVMNVHLPVFGNPIPSGILSRAIKSFPKAWALLGEMERAPQVIHRDAASDKTSPALWEAHIARLLQRRLVERVLEGDTLTEYEQTLQRKTADEI